LTYYHKCGIILLPYNHRVIKFHGIAFTAKGVTILGNFNILTISVIVIALVFILCGIVLSLAISYLRISHEIKLINIEIKRTHGRERKHWKRRKRKLLLSVLPFFKK